VNHPADFFTTTQFITMTNDIIEKFLLGKEDTEVPVNIFFKQRNAIHGLFVKGNDYEELKAKNFWRIVSEAKIAEWKQTRNINLAKLFSGNDFSKLK
jgi:hypothetical protein